MRIAKTKRWKFTNHLLRHLEQSGDNSPVEVIVRIKDGEALTRPRSLAEGMSRYQPDEVAKEEQRRARDLLRDVTQYVQELERRGAPVRLLDTSWLTHSALVSATPAIVCRLAEREDVDLIDLNADAQVLAAH